MNEWHTTEVNIKEGVLLFQLKDVIGKRSNECKLAMNKFRGEIGRRFLICPQNVFLELSDKEGRDGVIETVFFSNVIYFGKGSHN